jgi:hypothetical protein
MTMRFVLAFCFAIRAAFSGVQDAGTVPSVTSIEIEPGTVKVLHMAPGYATAIKLPEETSSVVIGDPANFKAEHSESEPRLVLIKPITSEAVESNALITTRSGYEISLQLVSPGKVAEGGKVDFFVEYRLGQAMMAGFHKQSFLIPETLSMTSASLPPPLPSPDPLAEALQTQKIATLLSWTGQELRVAQGTATTHNGKTILPFSVLNESDQAIELLPPQIELSGSIRVKRKRIKAEPIPISEYRLTSHSLAPRERADGVVVFERPSFKQADETLQLTLARADRVDHPVYVSLPFSRGGGR